MLGKNLNGIFTSAIILGMSLMPIGAIAEDFSNQRVMQCFIGPQENNIRGMYGRDYRPLFSSDFFVLAENEVGKSEKENGLSSYYGDSTIGVIAKSFYKEAIKTQSIPDGNISFCISHRRTGGGAINPVNGLQIDSTLRPPDMAYANIERLIASHIKYNNSMIRIHWQPNEVTLLAAKTETQVATAQRLAEIAARDRARQANTNNPPPPSASLIIKPTDGPSLAEQAAEMEAGKARGREYDARIERERQEQIARNAREDREAAVRERERRQRVLAEQARERACQAQTGRSCPARKRSGAARTSIR